jgi:hypothetical protein
VADTRLLIRSSGYTVVDEQQQIQYWICNTVDTVADAQWQIHNAGYTAAPNQDTQWWTHSRNLGDLPDIVTSPPCSTFRILGAAMSPPMLVLYKAAEDTSEVVNMKLT